MNAADVTERERESETERVREKERERKREREREREKERERDRQTSFVHCAICAFCVPDMFDICYSGLDRFDFGAVNHVKIYFFSFIV